MARPGTWLGLSGCSLAQAATFMDELARRIARADNRGLSRSAARDHVRGRIGNALAVGVTKQIMSFLELAT